VGFIPAFLFVGANRMLSISIQGLDKVTEKLESMRRKVRHLEHTDVVHEMRDWEVEDMHRHNPGAKHIRLGDKVLIRAHSRYEVRRHQLAVRRLIKHGGAVRPSSTRPILRQMLIDRLHERMTRLLHEKLKW
jgi:hypothetical protein